MFRNYILITLRSLLKQGTFTIINVAGLTLGITICLIIFLFVKDQTSYDNFHTNIDNTYRLLRIGDLNDEKYLIGVTSSPFADALINDFPQDIIKTTRVMPTSALVSHDENSFIENALYLADSNFLQTFSYPLSAGDRNTALDLPNSMAITKAAAKKYFGDEDPLNKIITVDNQLDYIVTGVFDDLPAKSHLQFDLVGNLAPLRQMSFMSNWWNNGLLTYVTLNETTSVPNLESQFPAFMDKYFGDDFKTMKNRIDLTLQPLGDVYFQSEVQYDPVRHGNKSSIYVFSAIGIFIFIIACINFMNLATAKSVQRAKEVGVRKTLGSSKRLLALQFFGESIFVAIISVILAFTLTEISLPFFNEWFSLELVAVRDPLIIIPLAFGLVLVTGFISGVYPAVILSRFKPAEVLKGKVQSNKEGLTIRKGLVILQFGISVFLIVITLVVGKQLRFINEADLGFDKDEIVLLELNYSTINQNIETFKNRLLTNSSIKNVTLASGEPGGFHDTMASEVEGLEDRPRFRTLFTDENYIPTYDLEMVAGRNFSEEFSTDLEGALILNERAVRDLGMTNEDIIGKRIHTEFVDTTYKLVIGVVKDYHFGTLKTEVEPLMIHMTDQASLMSIKLQAGGDAKAALAFIESEWEKFVPFKPDFRFLDDKLDYLYQNERLQGRLFQLFSGVSIFIACLGIFGLASFTATQRRKEIGIRKALGASVKSISNLLARDYIKLVLIANIVALPVGWYLASKWLSEFTYRTSIDLSIFIIALVAALLIAILSVIFQSLRAALANPVDVLKEE